MAIRKKITAIFRSRVLWVGCGLLLVAIVAQHVYLYFAIEKIRNEIRVAGYPVMTSEMLASENQSDDKLRTKALYESAFDALTLGYEFLEPFPIFGECCDLPDWRASLSEDELALAERTLSENSKTLAELRPAVETETFQFWVAQETNDYLGQIMSWYMAQSDSGRLLALESLYMAETGNLSAASESIVTGLSVARVYQPFAMGLLVSVATDGYARQAFENLINRHELSRGDLETLQTAFESASLDNRAAFAVATEACFWIQAVDEETYEPEFAETPFVQFEGPVLSKVQESVVTAWRFSKRQGARIFGIHARVKLLTYQTAKRCIELSELPTFEATQRLQQFIDDQSGRWPNGWVITAQELDFDIFLRLVSVEGRRIASDRAVTTAAAIQMYTQHVGEHPENLQDLVPKYISTVPTDPFDGNELRYAQTAEGYVVYSIAQDLKDDGGEYLHDSEEASRDVGVVIRRDRAQGANWAVEELKRRNAKQL